MGFLSGTKDSKKSSSSQNRTQPSLQKMLRTSSKDDPAEKEADRVAERVVARLSAKERTEEVSRAADEEPKEAQLKAAEEEPLKMQEEEEEEPINAQTEEEKEPLKTKEHTDEPIDMQEEEDALQAKPASDKEITDPQVEELLATTRGGGSPMEPEVLKEMEERFGRSFSAVRIHTDATAARLCGLLGAKAFTYGNHIYFSEGAYQPDTKEGKKLLAHELTHVVQQRKGAKAIQRQATAGTEGNTRVDATQLPESVGRLGTGGESDRIFFDKIEVPGFKLRDHRAGLYSSHTPLIYRKGYTRGNTKQRDVWHRNVKKDGIERKIKEILRKGYKAESINDSEKHLVKVRPNNRPVLYYHGTVRQIAERLLIPDWGGRAHRPPYRYFHVDHILELQLANWTGSGWANTIENMELLEAKMNIDSGNYIKNRINAKVRKFIEETRDKSGKSPYGNNVAEIKKKYHLVFRRAVKGRAYPSVPRTKFWKRDEIESAEHLRPLKPALLSEIGGNGYVKIFPSETGGLGKSFRWPGGLRSSERDWFRAPFVVKEKHFNTEDEKAGSEDFGYLKVNVSPQYRDKFEFSSGEDKQILLSRFGEAQFAGYIRNKNAIREQLRRDFKVKKLSPVEIDTFDIHPERGIICTGRILPTIPLFEKADIRFSLDKGELKLYKVFTIDEITIPPPFTISSASLELFGSTTRGIGLKGRADFGIQGLGNGYIEAAASTAGGIELEGKFDFEQKLFDPASVKVTYRDRAFGVEGQLGIPRGKVKGIKNASITVTYTERDGKLSAQGTAELDIPGIKSATVGVEYSDNAFSITGSAELRDDIPGIKSGNISVTVAKKADEEGYRLSASGEAVPNIPGIDTKLSVQYDDGAFLISGRVAYEKGMLSGEVDVAVSNRKVDKEGNPTDELTDTLSVYGGGQLTIRFTPWLEGTAGVRFLPNGEIEVRGKIGLPSSVDVFKRIEIPEKDLFKLGFDIPIFAIPVGPKSIGLVASIRGGLRAYAGIGPGRLEQLEVAVVYNPSREENTSITGTGKFVVPADAGLKLVVSASIGVSAVIAGVEGGLEVAGGIKLDAKAEAGVNVNWAPRTGITLKARLSATVEPKFTFDITGFIRAWVDLWLKSYEKRWDWDLANYEYGSNMRFGIHLPIVYKEGEPFDISFDDIRFERPQLGEGFLKGLINDIKNKRR